MALDESGFVAGPDLIEAGTGAYPATGRKSEESWNGGFHSEGAY